jgi:hypothetical protein
VREGGDKSDPPSNIFTKLDSKNAIKPPKRGTIPPKSSQPLYTPPPPQKFGKNLFWTLLLDFLNMCIYASTTTATIKIVSKFGKQ